MNVQQLVDKMSKEHKKVSKRQLREVVSGVFDVIQSTVKRGDSVKIAGFGTFLKIRRKARNGRNPQTGEAIKIGAMSLPKFRPGKEFKRLIKK